MKINVPTLPLSNLHFCHEDRVRYRKHLSLGMILSTALAMIATAYGLVWLAHLAAAFNVGTSLIWIWE